MTGSEHGVFDLILSFNISLFYYYNIVIQPPTVSLYTMQPPHLQPLDGHVTRDEQKASVCCVLLYSEYC
jgi:hypothetical protein